MTPEERAGFAAAINEAISLGVARACDELRGEHARTLAALRQEYEQFVHAQQLAELAAVARADRADARAEQLQRDLAATRELASQDAITDLFVDAGGVFRAVMRGGATRSCPIAELPELLNGLVATQLAAALVGMQAEIDAQVARGLMRLGDAPRWLQTAVYRAGDIVTLYNGRVYELQDGVAGSIAQEPGHHPQVWKRIGSGGMRVMKAKPAAIEPGDLFADAEAHFISDGVTTTLYSPKPFKRSDAERMVNPVQAETRAVAARTAGIERSLAEAVRIADEAAATAHRAGEAAAVAIARAEKAIADLNELLGPDGEAA